MRRPRDRRLRREDGSAAVEFALVLPILLLLALALVQVGLVIRDAAVAAAPGLDASGLELAVSRAGVRGDPVTVSVRYTAAIRVPMVSWLFGGSVGMSSAIAARQEFG